MNKKVLFFVIGFVLLLPVISSAATSAPTIIANIEGALYTIATTVIIIGWIIAGILYLTSMGNPEKTGTAKKAMIAAVTGTILIVLAKVAEELIRDLLKA